MPTELSPAAKTEILNATDAELRDMADLATDAGLGRKLRALANVARSRGMFDSGETEGWWMNFVAGLTADDVAMLNQIAGGPAPATPEAKPVAGQPVKA